MRIVPTHCVLLLAGGCAFASGPSTSASQSASYVVDADGECNQWRAATNADYEQCLEDRRHADQMASEEATRRTVALAASEQAGAAREATGSAMIGDGRNTGNGWWCFSGVYASQQRFGRCFRSMNRCASRLVSRTEDGMAVEEPRCSQQVSAARFTTVNRENGDVKHSCFPAASMCSPYEQAASKDATQETKTCAMYQ